MTKEEILNDIIAEEWDGKTVVPKRDAYQAMGNYARQEAILFAVWMHNNTCREGVDKWTCRVTQWKQTHTTNELYDIYQQQKQK